MAQSTLLVEAYRRIYIFHDEGDGFYASASCSEHFGYCDTLAEIRGEIDDHLAEDVGEPPLDTPCLDTSFHDREMAA